MNVTVARSLQCLFEHLENYSYQECLLVGFKRNGWVNSSEIGTKRNSWRKMKYLANNR